MPSDTPPAIISLRKQPAIYLIYVIEEYLVIVAHVFNSTTPYAVRQKMKPATCTVSISHEASFFGHRIASSVLCYGNNFIGRTFENH